jgi:hypothetical protein
MMQRRKHRVLRLVRTGTISDMWPVWSPARGPPAAGSALAPSEPATSNAAPASSSRNPLIADLQVFGNGHDTIRVARKPTVATAISEPAEAFTQLAQTEPGLPAVTAGGALRRVVWRVSRQRGHGGWPRSRSDHSDHLKAIDRAKT